MEGVASLLRSSAWSGWSTKIPVDDRDHGAGELAEASQATGATVSSAGGVEVAAQPADTASDAIRAVLMYHLTATRTQVRTALKAAEQQRHPLKIIQCCLEAEAVGVAETEIEEALAVAECATVMQGGSTEDIICCLDGVSHLSSEQTAQLGMRVEAEALFLMQKGDRSSARDLLRAAEIAGVSFRRHAHGVETVGMMGSAKFVPSAGRALQRKYTDEATEEAHANVISDTTQDALLSPILRAALEGMPKDPDAKKRKKRTTPLSMKLPHKADIPESHPSTAAAAAISSSSHIINIEHNTASAC
jgi:hypothetical protein